MACSALASCTTPMMALMITTAKIINESTTSCETTAEIIAATNNTAIIKSLNCSMNFCSILFFLPSSNSLGPNLAKRAFASLEVKPSRVVSNACVTSSTLFA